ncbi:MAG: carboxypeptidase-like regulatory domain-containing protein [Chitinophagaceae bacterium]
MKRNLFLLLLIAAACGKNSTQNTIPVPDLVQASQTRANIVGRILLYDEDGNLAADNSGITVAIDNSTVRTTTDATGNWKLDSIPQGTYDITYTKAGYGTGKIMGLHHAATNHQTTSLAKPEVMSTISGIEVTALQIAGFDKNPTVQNMISLGLAHNGVFIEPIFTNTSGKLKPVRFFFSDKNDVSSKNYTATFKLKMNGTNEITETMIFDTKWMNSNGFKTGQTVYVIAHGDGSVDDGYDDPASGVRVYPSISPKASPVSSFVVPK